MFKKTRVGPSSDRDLAPQGACLDGRSIRTGLPEGQVATVLELLPQHLRDDACRAAENGWCLATHSLLRSMLHAGTLKVDGFRQLTLANGDTMSSMIDRSQPTSDNTWALVAYNEPGPVAGGVYLCVVQVQCYVRIAAGSSSYSGFDPDQCSAAGLPLAPGPDGSAVRHVPLRLALCKMWLAQGATSAMGAVGCWDRYCPVTSRLPDLVVVSNCGETTPLITGSGSEVFGKRHNRRYFGLYIVDVNDLMCQLGPTTSGPGRRCFLVCNKMSGK